ncbi:MAG TPA: prolipoprotein diacylglyceryl transferase [Vicinamibacterales bacterium]|nr:prolipoprotein diacylglyceryl transferase [Vicinamibacterales bacterium]
MEGLLSIETTGTIGEVLALLFADMLRAAGTALTGPWVHRIDPIIGSIGGVHFWWYGLSYAAGFASAHLVLRRNRERLGLSLRSVYDLTLLLAFGALAGGRSLVVFVNEWPFYREHLWLVPAIWVGGLATHGLILGGAFGVLVFCLLRGVPFRPVFDVLAVAAALILGCGRIGNFIDGQIVGRITTVPWAVKFPEADGFRHPVVLYDGLKNFLLVPVLLWVSRRGAPPGRLAALFVLLYPALRIPIDLYREYPIDVWGLPAGQTYNLLMTLAGALLLLRNWLRRPEPRAWREDGSDRAAGRGLWWRRVVFAGLLVLVLTIPSDATRDVPVHYGHRHPGLTHSVLYPPL